MALLTHASFFTGAGGMDIGLERAGWKTVSFSEIEPYPCAVLSERWPDVPNLGDVTAIADVPEATLWTGGFPCQDLSVAGKRGGIDASRSGLAWAFLDLVERHRPEAFLLENVTGLLSSNAGRDFGRLLREVADLRFGWAYRVLDAQWFGVPQRRRRVFVLALDLERHPDPDSAGKVLAIGSSCDRNHPQEREAWAKATGRPSEALGRTGLDVAGNITRRYGKGVNTTFDDGAIVYASHVQPDSRDTKHSGISARHPVAEGGDGCRSAMESGDHAALCAKADAAGMREADGVAGRVDSGKKAAFVKVIRSGARDADGNLPPEVWAERQVAPTLNNFDIGDTRATTLVAETGVVSSLTKAFGRAGVDSAHAEAGWIVPASGVEDDALLPIGLDTARYKACGNGVAAPVSEWIGRRLAHYLSKR